MAGPRPGEVLNDRYELIDRIGGGSMGEVWRGRDLVLGRTVAVKIVLPALLDTPTFRQRFVAEARVMAMMDHPGIVRVYDYGYTDAAAPDTSGAAFLVMEFIEGESLDRVLARTGPLEPRFAMKVLASLLDALAAVHRTGVVHRDVKPANVMLTSGGVVLADFGIARSAESLGLTAADALMGTVPYLAPELFHAETPTPAADVYAVGILGYELLSGRQPFQAASTAAVMYMHMHEPPPPLPDYVATPAAEVLWHALEKDPAHRWADGAEMAEAVRHVLTGPVETGEDLAAAPGPGGRHGGVAGNPSGYEDTLTDSGGRRRRRPAVEGGYAAAGGAAGAAAAAGVGGYAAPGGGYDGYDGLYGDTGQAGRYGRDAAFGESAASGFGVGAGYGPAEYDDEYQGTATVAYNEGLYGDGMYVEGVYDDGIRGEGIRGDLSEPGGRHGRASALDETAQLGGMPETGTRRRPGDFPADGTRVYDEIPPSLSDSGGRRGRGGDLPDATRLYDDARIPGVTPMADSSGRHAGASHGAAEPPLRRRAAEADQGPSTGFGGRGGGPRPLRPDLRRKGLIAAAVAVPAVLGLSVALAMSSSGKSPDGGPAPGPTQSDVPTTDTGTGDTTPPTEPVPTSTSVYGHTGGYTHHSYASYPSSTHSATSGASTSATDPATSGSRSDQPTGSPSSPSSSGSSLPSSTDSSTQGSSTPSSTPPSHPASSAS